MAELRIDLVDGRHAFEPGEEILGVASWDVAGTPEEAEVRLFWHTQGKGMQDVGIVARERWSRPGTTMAEDFRFVAPSEPHSYEGRLVSIAWALELVVDGEKSVARLDLVIGPRRTAVGP